MARAEWRREADALGARTGPSPLLSWCVERELASVVVCGARAVSEKFRPDGGLCVSRGADCMYAPQGISDVVWSTDSRYLASASDDKTVKVPQNPVHHLP